MQPSRFCSSHTPLRSSSRSRRSQNLWSAADGVALEQARRGLSRRPPLELRVPWSDHPRAPPAQSADLESTALADGRPNNGGEVLALQLA